MSDLVTRPCRGTVPETVGRLIELLEAREIKLFAVVDHRAAAEAAGLSLRDTTVVIFGNPMGGTPVMEAVPTAALDLPLKILVWDDAGQTKISYLDPHALAARYAIPGELVGPLAGIVAVADALTNANS